MTEDRRWRWRPLAIRVLAVSLSTFAALAALEGALRLTRDPGRFYPYAKNTVRATYPTEEITRGVSGVAYFTTNSLGCRGPELKNEKHRLLTIGGSTTACSVLNDDEAWPQLVMDYVNQHFQRDDFLWITNSGMDGRSTCQHIMHAKFLVPKIPRLEHALIYCGFNDLGGWLIQETGHDFHFPLTQENIDRSIPRSFEVSNYSLPGEPWYRRLELWKRLSTLKHTYQTRRMLTARAHGGIVEDDRMRWMERERQRRSEEKVRSVDLAKMATLNNALDAYGENLTAIIKLVREAHVEPILMAQMMQFDDLTEQQKKELWIGAMEGSKTYVDVTQMQDLLRKYNAKMEAVAKEHKVLFIPLPKLLEGKRDLFYDSIHFHEAGSREVARAVAEFLIQNLYAPSAKKTAALQPAL